MIYLWYVHDLYNTILKSSPSLDRAAQVFGVFPERGQIDGVVKGQCRVVGTEIQDKIDEDERWYLHVERGWNRFYVGNQPAARRATL